MHAAACALGDVLLRQALGSGDPCLRSCCALSRAAVYLKPSNPPASYARMHRCTAQAHCHAAGIECAHVSVRGCAFAQCGVVTAEALLSVVHARARLLMLCPCGRVCSACNAACAAARRPTTAYRSQMSCRRSFGAHSRKLYCRTDRAVNRWRGFALPRLHEALLCRHGTATDFGR